MLPSSPFSAVICTVPSIPESRAAGGYDGKYATPKGVVGAESDDAHAKQIGTDHGTWKEPPVPASYQPFGPGKMGNGIATPFRQKIFATGISCFVFNVLSGSS
jgi:hypothetical protein